jgi:hypothetical protein
LKKIVAMTEKEDSSGGNRRQSQVKVTIQKMSNRHTEAPGEGPAAAAGAEASISVVKGTTGEITATKDWNRSSSQDEVIWRI